MFEVGGQKWVDIFFGYFPLFSAYRRRLELEPGQEASVGGPLSTDMASFPGGAELAVFKKMEKLKNRHLI